MKRSGIYRVIVCLLLLSFCVNAGGITAAADKPVQMESMRGARVVLRADPNFSTHRVPAPARARALQSAPSATFTVYYIPDGQQDFFGETCLTWPSAAQTAFNYAADIWATLIHSSVPIIIHACWTNLGAGYLGYGGADHYQRNFSGAPTLNTWYPSALANALAGSDLSSSRPDMHLGYNKAMADAGQWYFGTDGNPGAKYDFVSVVLHEIAHGLGFSGSMEYVGGSGRWGAGTPYPDSYDRFTQDGSGNALLNTTLYPNPSTALGAALTSNNVWFNGANANAANGGNRVKLYAPATWQPGSSYAHLDNSFDGTPNALMTYALNNGESVHGPGPVTMGLLQDIGWPQPAANTAPTLSGLPDLALAPGASRDNAIDLWTYAADDLNADSALTFSIANSPPGNAGVTIDSQRYIDINPTSAFTGTVSVVVQVMDTGGLTDTDDFSITFVEVETSYVYLPLLTRCYPLLPFFLPISNADGDGLYTLRWQMPAYASPPTQYELQGATNPQFSSPQSRTESGTSVNMYSPDPATYYWRVRAYINGQWTGWSNAQSVAVGSFSYVYVQNDTGGALTIEIVGVEKRSFPTGSTYWRSVPTGYRTVNVWANCGSLLGRNIYFEQGDFLLHYYCGYQSLVALPSAATTVIPGVERVFNATAP